MKFFLFFVTLNISTSYTCRIARIPTTPIWCDKTSCVTGLQGAQHTSQWQLLSVLLIRKSVTEHSLAPFNGECLKQVTALRLT